MLCGHVAILARYDEVQLHILHGISLVAIEHSQCTLEGLTGHDYALLELQCDGGADGLGRFLQLFINIFSLT